jgi:hypothetical protein
MSALRDVIPDAVLLRLTLGAALCAVPTVLPAGEVELRGEISASGILSDAKAADAQWRARYLPELRGTAGLGRTWTLEVDVSANAFLAEEYLDGDRLGEREGDVELYRGSIRLATPRFEARAGLQKISFGSASVFRPLMWFDRVDPRDPLQFSEGVYGLLLRYTLPGNANFWAWGLYGNEDPKGWELLPTDDDTPELGGRVQVPMPRGEVAASYHHRRVDLAAVPAPPSPTLGGTIPEDRVGFDGKWDLGIGAWVEASLARQDDPRIQPEWRHAVTLGVDYTFRLGQGLTALAEHFVLEGASVGPLVYPDLSVTAFGLTYPIGAAYQARGLVYYDWEEDEAYRFVELRRTTDHWRFHLIGFWNPQGLLALPQQQPAGSLAGKGVQLIVVFNH